MKCSIKYSKTGRHPSIHEQASSMTLGKFDHTGMDGADATADPTIDARTQYGALCWRMHRGKVEVLLITSRDTGRWVIPKGWPIDGLAPAQTAAREAWEEAGVEKSDQGIELHDTKLASALLYKQDFSREEIDKFESVVPGVGVPYDCFINARGKYFKPVVDWWGRE